MSKKAETETSSLMDMFDPQKMFDQFKQAMNQFGGTEVDFSAMLDAQRKNVEAMSEANRNLWAGTEALLKRQSELMEQASKEAMETFKGLVDVKPEELATKQAELFTQAYERASSNMQEIAEVVRKAQEDAMQAMDKRFRESLEEVKALVTKKS
ncbi:MAG: phasin family protein [Thiotrichales bacterium]